MAKLKIGLLSEDKSVKVNIELPAQIHRDLILYAEAVAREGGEPVSNPSKLIVPMLARFMATDRAFMRARKLLLRQREEKG